MTFFLSHPQTEDAPQSKELPPVQALPFNEVAARLLQSVNSDCSVAFLKNARRISRRQHRCSLTWRSSLSCSPHIKCASPAPICPFRFSPNPLRTTESGGFFVHSKKLRNKQLLHSLIFPLLDLCVSFFSTEIVFFFP